MTLQTLNVLKVQPQKQNSKFTLVAITAVLSLVKTYP